MVYIAGYMASRVVRKFADNEDCPCKEYNTLTTDIPADSQYAFLKGKHYDDLQLGEMGLKVDLVIASESNFRKNISSVIHTVGIGIKLFTSSMVIVCECR